jgi:membrane fusion protein
MSSPAHDLFRQEALAARADNSAGPALRIRPVGATRLTLFFAALALAVLLLLIFGSYTKKERVQGAIQARDGVAMVVPPEAGLVQRVLVKDGQTVQAGQPLMTLSHDRQTDAGSTQALLSRNLQGQRQQVQTQTEAQQRAMQATWAGLAQRIAQGQRNADSLAEEIRLQGQQVASSRKLLDQLQPLLAERIVSELQYEQQRQALLDQSARLQALERQRSAALADVALAREERERVGAEHRVTQATLDRDLLTLQQQEVQRQSAGQTVLTAPIAGTVTSLLVHAGQSVPAGASLAAIVPADSPMTAVLYVPSTAIGFIAPGQRVRVSYDAFPYQRFGQYHGVVHSVSQTDVPMAANPDKQDRRAYFLVRVRLDASNVKAYGAEIPLRPGLTLTADVEIDRRSLIRWMLDPLFAFTGKL